MHRTVQDSHGVPSCTWSSLAEQIEGGQQPPLDVVGVTLQPCPARAVDRTLAFSAGVVCWAYTYMYGCMCTFCPLTEREGWETRARATGDNRAVLGQPHCWSLSLRNARFLSVEQPCVLEWSQNNTAQDVALESKKLNLYSLLSTHRPLRYSVRLCAVLCEGDSH